MILLLDDLFVSFSSLEMTDSKFVRTVRSGLLRSLFEVCSIFVRSLIRSLFDVYQKHCKYQCFQLIHTYKLRTNFEANFE